MVADGVTAMRAAFFEFEDDMIVAREFAFGGKNNIVTGNVIALLVGQNGAADRSIAPIGPLSSSLLAGRDAKLGGIEIGFCCEVVGGKRVKRALERPQFP